MLANWINDEIIGSYKPIVAIEHENLVPGSGKHLKNVIGSFWKVMAVRSDLHVIITYYRDKQEQEHIIQCLRQMLENTTLGKESGEVLILLGNCGNIGKNGRWAICKWGERVFQGPIRSSVST
ncbi:MAG: hypothetical protein ONB17_08555 [candidate division KSB1 bacterium]|nr:hypothetical protein [candidate division KSB1 bacterium]